MKKAELMKRIPKKLPEENMARIIRACGTHVLMLILPVNSKTGSEESGIAHFVWETGYATYYLNNHIWTREALDTVEDGKTPYYTIQTDIQRIQQFYAAYDRQPDKEIVEKILTAWLKQVKQNYRQIIEEEGKEVLQAAG